jgi:hypothetical protein
VCYLNGKSSINQYLNYHLKHFSLLKISKFLLKITTHKNPQIDNNQKPPNDHKNRMSEQEEAKTPKSFSTSIII